MKRTAYCPSCGWEREVREGKSVLKAANAHNEICPAQRPGYEVKSWKASEVEGKDFQWYAGWEKDWEMLERKVWEEDD